MQQEQQQERAVHLGTCSNMESVTVEKQKTVINQQTRLPLAGTSGVKLQRGRGISGTGLRFQMLRTVLALGLRGLL